LSPTCASPDCQFIQHNGFLCRTCTDKLRGDLSAVPWLLEDLEVTICRLDKLHDPTGRSGGEKPLPIRLHAMEARRDLNTTLASWAVHIAGRLGGLDRDTIWTELRLAAYLLRNLNTILTDPNAGMIADEVGYARRMAQKTIDKPEPRVFVGPCEFCEMDMYAHPSAAEVVCKNPDCGDEPYPIEARRRWLLGKAQDQLLTAIDMSRALAGLLPKEKTITASMLRGLARRGRLTQHAPLPDQPKRPRYRVGQLLEILFEDEEDVPGRPGQIAC
jgi:hypothetical protein